MCTNSVYSLASLFLPSVFAEKDIPGFWVGLVFAWYSIAVVIVSPFIGTILKKTGTANLIAIGLFMMSISIVPIGYLIEIENDTTTLAVALLLRTLQGTASAAINTTCYSLAANKYSSNTLFVVGMMEGMSGVGIVIGLLGGSAVYEAMGYEAVFITFGLILLAMAFISRGLFMLIDRKQSETDEDDYLPAG